MAYLSSAELRALFLEYFQERGHAVVASSPLVPGNDPTLLFTNAGMVQFKDVFLGRETRPYSRAASSQRCVRAGGKHNDLENVGYTARHHTFFEMLGNFSFGDYFKHDAIRFGWDFLTRVLQLPPERLWVTVFDEDREAESIWLDEVGISPLRFSRIGGKDNFWSMGDVGPCGPCTEIFYDHGEDIPGGPPGSPDAEGDRYIEIWNLVFMQYDRAADGTLTPLPKPSVDTGMGLERLAAVMQGVHSNYETDLFKNLLRRAAELAGMASTEHASLRVIADHIRSCAFLIADGVVPSNEGRGYVLRRILRRAIRHGYKLGLREAFFHKLVAPLCAEMGGAYPELAESQQRVTGMLKSEEDRFFETIDRGMINLLDRLEGMTGTAAANYVKANVWAEWEIDAQILSEGHWSFYRPNNPGDGITVQQAFERRFQRWLYVINFPTANEEIRHIQKRLEKLGNDRPDDWLIVVVDDQTQAQHQGNMLQVGFSDIAPYRILNGNLAFILYDTYGFPLDLTQDVCREHNVAVDVAGFEIAMNRQREQSRAASHFGADYDRDVEVEGTCEFTGYEHLLEQTRILGLWRDGQAVETLHAGEEATVVLEKTPFYGESGGQAGDTGKIIAGEALFEVRDTHKQGAGLHLHKGRLVHGVLRKDDPCQALVDPATRQATALNHSATHLLHAALRRVLGAHVMQKGSLVNTERLRFDFAHDAPMTSDEIARVERLVNEQIRANNEVRAEVMALDAAKATGAMALFGEKYGDRVRVLRIGEFSTELCGGTHTKRAGDIGLFKIVAETGVAAGVRRVEAVTGEAAITWVEEADQLLRNLCASAKTSRDALEERLQQMLDKARAVEKELERLKGKLASAAGSDLSAQAVDIEGVKVLAVRLDDGDPKALRDLVDQLKNKLGSAAVVLALAKDDKVSLAAGVTKDLSGRISAVDLVNAVAAPLGGKGGGRPDFAQAGAGNAAGLPAALEGVADWVRQKTSS